MIQLLQDAQGGGLDDRDCRCPYIFPDPCPPAGSVAEAEIPVVMNRTASVKMPEISGKFHENQQTHSWTALPTAGLLTEPALLHKTEEAADLTAYFASGLRDRGGKIWMIWNRKNQRM